MKNNGIEFPSHAKSIYLSDRTDRQVGEICALQGEEEDEEDKEEGRKGMRKGFLFLI